MTFDEWRETQLRSGQIVGPREAYEAGAASERTAREYAEMVAAGAEGRAEFDRARAVSAEVRARNAEARVRELEASMRADAAVIPAADAHASVSELLAAQLNKAEARVKELETEAKKHAVALAQVAALREVLDVLVRAEWGFYASCILCHDRGAVDPDDPATHWPNHPGACSLAGVFPDTARAAAEHDERVRRVALEEASKLFCRDESCGDPLCDSKAVRALAAKPKDGET